MSKVKVLCLCGGGIFGAIIAKFLTYVPKDFVNKIDVLSGCSIGGILTNAYASGADPEKVLHAFLQQGKQIFSKRLVARINPLASPTYENQNLKKMIVQFCGDKKLKDINKLYPNLKTIIPTLNITDDQYVVFRNFVDSDDNIDLVTLSLMTSAAPTYFQGIQYKGKCYVDGGMIQVAPLLTTVTALKNRLGIDFKDMDVLMLGTGSLIDKTPITYQKYVKFNQLDVCLKIIVPYVTLSNQLSTKYWAKGLGFNSFQFFNPIQIWGGLDETKNMDTMMEDCEMYKKKFLISWHNFIG